MIRTHITSSLTLSGIREEAFEFLEASSNFFPVWRNDSDHSEGIAVYYDAAHTDLCCMVLVNNNYPSGYSVYQVGSLYTVFFPYGTGKALNVCDNNAVPESDAYTRCQIVETGVGFGLFLNPNITDRKTRTFFVTKNRGCSVNFAFANTPIDRRAFVFDGDSTYIEMMNRLPEETVMTCFAPLAGKSQDLSNNMLYYTPFTSTPDYACIVDSEIGRFITDGYFAIPEEV